MKDSEKVQLPCHNSVFIYNDKAILKNKKVKKISSIRVFWGLFQHFSNRVNRSRKQESTGQEKKKSEKVYRRCLLRRTGKPRKYEKSNDISISLQYIIASSYFLTRLYPIHSKTLNFEFNLSKIFEPCLFGSVCCSNIAPYFFKNMFFISFSFLQLCLNISCALQVKILKI